MEELSHTSRETRRIIVIDDTESIHRDYDKILTETRPTESEQALQALDSFMFDDNEPDSLGSVGQPLPFEVAHAMQGQEGYNMILAARDQGRPFSVAFVDMRMPPGWDGLQTITTIWEKDPYLQIVICSAYADYTWSQIIERLGHSDRLLILKKPFDEAEVYQLATALSEKWLAERSTRDLLANLEEKVECRTREVRSANLKLIGLNKDLEIAVTEAECAARAKGRFLATMSHEIRTTLNGIMGAAHMLNSADLPKAEREFAEIIQSSGEALMIIINDILDYSKYETGQIELEAIPFSLKDLISECSALLDSVIQKNKITFEIRWDDRIPAHLVGDPARIRQVLLNLINNALKFAKGGNVAVAARLLGRADDKIRLGLDVIDNGIGMKAETLDRLFTAFMQADSSTTRQYGGTGLGLAISKLLAEAMQAEIKVESEPGRGSTFGFHLELPIARLDRGQTLRGGRLHAANEPREDEESEFLRGKRVLLVDDNAVNRKLGKHFLQKFNIEATVASDGREAIELVMAAPPFDLILMDLQMPELDGLQATEAIRQFEGESSSAADSVPIIALTANAFSEVRDDCLRYGMNDFLTKPLRIDELGRILEAWIPRINTDASGGQKS